MHINYYDEPWEFFDVREFLTPQELIDLRSYMDNLPGDFDGSLRLNRELSELEFDDQSNVIAARFKELLELIGAPYNAGDHEIVLEYDKSKPGFDYKVHSDVVVKEVSFVLHVSEKGNGTRLYKELDKTGMRTIDWIPAGGGGFKNDTYKHHSFDNLKQTTVRHTVIITLRRRGVEWRTA